MTNTRQNPFGDWRLLIAHSDEPLTQQLESVFEGRVASIECVHTGGNARSRLADTFGKAIKLLLLDYRLIGEKDVAGWQSTLKNSLTKPAVIVLNDDEPQKAAKLCEALKAIGQTRAQQAPSEFIREFVRLARQIA
jgi:DNA-binding response OmpR family regulator